MTADLPYIFLIKRQNIQLKVTINNRVVGIQPHDCRPENKRLCSGIAATQRTLAQLTIEDNKAASPYVTVVNLFQRSGWEVTKWNE